MKKPENCKNNLFCTREGTTDDINDSVSNPEKKFSINFATSKTIFFWSSKIFLYYNGDVSYLNINETENCKLKAIDNIPPYTFYFRRKQWKFYKQ